jgi:hypothetical protein
MLLKDKVGDFIVVAGLFIGAIIILAVVFSGCAALQKKAISAGETAQRCMSQCAVQCAIEASKQLVCPVPEQKR